MEELPPNLVSEAALIGRIVEKASRGKGFNSPEKAAIDRYQKIYDKESSYTYVSSQLDLAREVGVESKTIQRRISAGGSPGKDKAGYCVEKWKEFMSIGAGEDVLSDYALISGPNETNSAKVHADMLKKVGELHAKLEHAEKQGDLKAIDVFEKRWLAVANKAKDFENLIQKHELEIGETIKVSEMEEVEFFIILVLLDATNRFIDEFAIRASACDSAREIRQASESLFDEIVQTTFSKAVKGKHLDPRVLTIFERALLRK